jgi:hypothetical protein
MRKPLVVFKYEDEEDDGTPVGPVWIDYFGEDPVKPAIRGARGVGNAA